MMDVRVTTVQNLVYDYEEVVDIQFDGECLIILFDSGNIVRYFKQQVVSFETTNEGE